MSSAPSLFAFLAKQWPEIHGEGLGEANLSQLIHGFDFRQLVGEILLDPPPRHPASPG